MIHDEHRKFSIEYKKFYYDLHGKISKLCFTFLVVPAPFGGAVLPPTTRTIFRDSPVQRSENQAVAHELRL